ncbi:MAG: TrmJ/YjtD family RNA methyltransferase [Gemmatimonadota bacterium]|nr:TrmJ/YjtD family RNA methyltransferase [Gemmatimonadota bacterium]
MTGDRETALDRTIIVLHEPQDLVNIALIIRAMKNMGLATLRLVRPVEFDAWRITGIAHDTGDIVEAVEIFDDLPSALADCAYVLGATARRRTVKQDWWDPATAAAELTARGDRVAIVLGREDRGLSNEQLDLCHGLVCIPTSDHSSMNIGHAAVVIFYEWRRAALAESIDRRDLVSKKQRDMPAATHEELEVFFERWQRAMEEIGLFRGVDPIPKMRSFRRMFQRADLDRRELGLIEASAWEIIHFAEREKKRARERAETEAASPESPHRA